MAESQDIIKNFLWDIYLIDYYKKNLEKFENFSDDEKSEINKHLLLDNLFLLRRVKDPGFYWYVSEQVYLDKSILDQVKRYLQKLFSEYIYKTEEDIFKLYPEDKKIDEDLLDERIIQPVVSLDKSHFEILNDFIKINENALKYLRKRFEKAVFSNNIYEMMAIELMIKEYSTGRYIGHMFFSPLKPYKGSTYTEYWQYLGIKYLFTYIRFSDIYFETIFPDDIAIRHPTAAFIKLEKVIVEKILKTIMDSSEVNMNSNFLQYSKLIADTISIASIVWFNNKSEKEKRDILNKYYPYSIKKSWLKEIYKDSGEIDVLVYLAQIFYQKGYLDEAKDIYTFSLSKCSDNLCKYSCYENIATTHRELGNHEKALQNFLKCLKFLKTIENVSMY